MTAVLTTPDVADGRAALLGLWARNLPGADAERHAWLYEHGGCEAMLARQDDGAAIGAVGLMPRTMRVGDRAVRVGQTIDLNVDRDHRTMGVAISLQRTLLARADERDLPFVYAIPTPAAAAILRRVGYRDVGPIGHWTKPLSAEYKLRDRAPPAVARAGAWLLAPWIRLRYGEPAVSPAVGRLVQLREFDARFDALARAASDHFPILGDRGAAYLDWRFRRCPHLTFETYGVVAADNALLGYVVCRRDPGDVIQIRDFLGRDPLATAQVLASFCRQMRRDGMQAIQLRVLGPVWLDASLHQLGFRRRETSDTLAVAERRPSAQSPFDAQHWFFTPADLDVEP